ncbi:MAG: hypothetical protein NW214_00805 [Pseudanabaenaceae cyanobacterium bins.39]|nr:hypothetical protein [Pseudanabaenaceae cyanobacterium bins.39]
MSKNLDVAAYTVVKHITQDVTFFYKSSGWIYVCLFGVGLLCLIVMCSEDLKFSF